MEVTRDTTTLGISQGDKNNLGIYDTMQHYVKYKIIHIMYSY